MYNGFRFLRALARQPVDCTPVWMMRQAGRYLPEYRALREKMGGFLAMCKTPSVAAEITLQPLQRYDLDAAIIFSDILTIPDAMGLGLYFETNEGPQFERPIRTQADVENIHMPDPEADLGYVLEAVRQTKAALKDKAPLIGFCGSPWTVATYMVEGKSSRNFSIIKTMMYQAPQLLKQLLDKIARASSAYLQGQIEAGADAVMIFDTWGGALTPHDYQQFSLYYMQQIVQHLKAQPSTQKTPIIMFTKQGGQWLEWMAQTGCDALGLDWTTELGSARARVGHKVALQGNMDPSILLAPDQRIREEVQRILASFGAGSGHVFNLGHGITPDVQPEKVQVMLDALREFSPQYHHKELIHG